MRVHHYEDDAVRSFDADPDKPIAEYIEIEEEERLFLVSDEGQEIEVGALIKEITITEVLPVVVHRHPMIEVTVHYSGRQATFEVSPGARVGAVRNMAIVQLGIEDSDAADLGLRTMDGTEDLPVNEPIGKIAGKHHHRVEVQLVAMVHPQG